MRPLPVREWRPLHNHQPLQEYGIPIRRQVFRIPGFERAEDTPTEMARLVVFREVRPNGGIIIGLARNLNRIAKAGFQVLLLGSGVKTRLQDRRGFNLVALASIVSARLSIIGEGLSLSTGRFCGRVSSPGMRNSL